MVKIKQLYTHLLDLCLKVYNCQNIKGCESSSRTLLLKIQLFRN